VVGQFVEEFMGEERSLSNVQRQALHLYDNHWPSNLVLYYEEDQATVAPSIVSPDIGAAYLVRMHHSDDDQPVWFQGINIEGSTARFGSVDAARFWMHEAVANADAVLWGLLMLCLDRVTKPGQKSIAWSVLKRADFDMFVSDQGEFASAVLTPGEKGLARWTHAGDFYSSEAAVTIAHNLMMLGDSTLSALGQTYNFSTCWWPAAPTFVAWWEKCWT
jgi:hypothetical protein